MPILYGLGRPKKRTTKARGYGHDWRRYSERHRRDYPLCGGSANKAREGAFGCLSEGHTTEATEVDHIVPLVDGGARLDPMNTQSLCRAHHHQKTQEEKCSDSF